MRALLESDAFRGELVRWVMPGLLCAAPSAGWAFVAGFNDPVEWAAMAMGVGACVAGFAWGCSREWIRATEGRRSFVRTLRRAAWLKAAALIGVVAGWVGGLMGNADPALLPVVMTLPDFLGGMVVLTGTARLAGVKGPEALAGLDSFGWTGFTTLGQGVFVTALLVVTAFALLGMLQLWRLAVARGSSLIGA